MKKVALYLIIAVVTGICLTGCGKDSGSEISPREIQYTILPFKGIEISIGKSFPVFYGADIEHGYLWPLRISNFNSYQPGSWYNATIESLNGTLLFKSAETIHAPANINYESLQLTATPIDDYACDATDSNGNKYENINIEGLEMLSKGAYVVNANKVTITLTDNSTKVYFLLTGVISRP